MPIEHKPPKYLSEIDVNLVQSMGGDHMAIAAAKVSTNGADAMKYAIDMIEFHSNPTGAMQDLRDKNFHLINYLMKHRHGTPFEHSSLTFYVHAPIFVWREWHRHRIGFSYNEESGRYKQLEPVFYLPPRDRPMFKVEDWKPGRPKFMRLDEFNLHLESEGKAPDAESRYGTLVANLRQRYADCYRDYEDHLAMGFDPGLARDCLNVGTYSGCWVTCNPRSLMAFLSLRTHEMDAKFVSYPLYEIEVAARKVESIFAQTHPLTYKAFVENGRVGP